MVGWDLVETFTFGDGCSSTEGEREVGTKGCVPHCFTATTPLIVDFGFVALMDHGPMEDINSHMLVSLLSAGRVIDKCCLLLQLQKPIKTRRRKCLPKVIIYGCLKLEVACGHCAASMERRLGPSSNISRPKTVEVWHKLQQMTIT